MVLRISLPTLSALAGTTFPSVADKPATSGKFDKQAAALAAQTAAEALTVARKQLQMLQSHFMADVRPAVAAIDRAHHFVKNIRAGLPVPKDEVHHG
jgi:hypothetical protein